MTESLLTSQTPDSPASDTPQIPQKFLDPQTGAPDVAKLVRSYLELERKLSTMVRVPRDGADETETAAAIRAAWRATISSSPSRGSRCWRRSAR